MNKFVFLSSLLIFGCIGGVKIIKPQEAQRLFNKPVDEVWESVLELITKLGCPIKDADRDKGLIITYPKSISKDEFAKFAVESDAMGVGYSKITPEALYEAPSVSIKCIVDSTDGTTRVKIEPIFYARSREYKKYKWVGGGYWMQGDSLTCVSRGVIEEHFFANLSKSLGVKGKKPKR